MKRPQMRSQMRPADASISFCTMNFATPRLMNHTTFAVDIDVNDYVLADQQTIKAHQITLDTNLEFG